MMPTAPAKSANTPTTASSASSPTIRGWAFSVARSDNAIAAPTSTPAKTSRSAALPDLGVRCTLFPALTVPSCPVRLAIPDPSKTVKTLSCADA